MSGASRSRHAAGRNPGGGGSLGAKSSGGGKGESRIDAKSHVAPNDPVSVDAMRKAEVLMAEHGKLASSMGASGGATLTWHANWAVGSPFDPISGHTYAVDSLDAPIVADMLPPYKLYYGVSALKLGPDARDRRTGKPLSEHALVRDAEQLLASLNDAVAVSSTKPASIGALALDSGYDAREWQSQLGARNSGACVGVFMTSRRGEHRYETDFYLVAQAGAPEASVEAITAAQQRAADAGKAAPTWRTMFAANHEMDLVSAAAHRNRARLLAAGAEALSIDAGGASGMATSLIDVDRHSAEFGSRRGYDRAAVPLEAQRVTVETVSNYMAVDAVGRPTFYAGTTTLDAGGQMLFAESPHLGMTLYSVPTAISDALGPLAERAVPVCAGRVDSQRRPSSLLSSIGASSGVVEEAPFHMTRSAATFTWPGKDAVNVRLADGLYRRRDDVTCCSALGVSNVFAMTELQPLLVKINEPPPMARASSAQRR